MKIFYFFLKLPVIVFGVIIVFASRPIFAANLPINVKTTIILFEPFLEKEGSLLPEDILYLALPIFDSQICKDLILIPEVQILRMDLANSTPEALPKLPMEKGLAEKIAEAFGKVPDGAVWKEKVENSLKSVKITKEWIQPGNREVSFQDLANDAVIRRANLRFIIPAKPGEFNKDSIQKLLPGLPSESTVLLENETEWKTQMLANLCPGNGMNASDADIALIYKPSLAVVVTDTSSVKPPEDHQPTESFSNCASQFNLNQGIQFISLSKSKSGAIEKKSDLNNAFKIFDTIAKESESAGQCCAKALMNRGIVRDMLGEPELALQDLTSAQQCDSQSWEAHYNLAAYHVKHKFPKPDLALQELDKTFSLGYKDCDQLLNDQDFKKLLRDREFNGKLKELLHRYGLYCELPKPHV
jgi:hypothetical protein